MLRRALILLLALVLGLNGLLAPLAMAAPPPAANGGTQQEGHCHGMDESAMGAGSEQAPDPQHPQPDCCTQGHCLCACLFSLHLPYQRLSTAPRVGAIVANRGVAAIAAVQPGVPLRPPIA